MIKHSRGSAPSTDAEAIADAFRPVILKMSRELRREARDIGLSALDAQLLGLVLVRPGIGISELAAIEKVSRPSMSAHIKRLLANGWLAREAEPDADRRRVRLTLTDEARKTLMVIRRNRNDWLAARIALLSETERKALSSAVTIFVRLSELES